jgi:hypothetical protein
MGMHMNFIKNGKLFKKRVCITFLFIFTFGAFKLYDHFRLLVTVQVDGGISSQMYQYMIGQRMKELGYNVKYDLVFYRLKKGNKDCDDRFARNFDLLKAFPQLDFQAASRLEGVIGRKLLCYKNKTNDRLDYLKQKPPIHLGGYLYDVCKDDLPPYKKYFSFQESILNEESKIVLKKIRNQKNSVCVHVRLGDMGPFSTGKWHVPPEYFVSAINLMKKKFPDAYFFFFSEELDLVQKEITPKLGNDIDYDIVNINKSEEGYMDLFLCSECKHQIVSVGSWVLPMYGLNKYSGKVLITPHNITSPNLEVKIVRDRDRIQGY